jgi:hypothetical protein
MEQPESSHPLVDLSPEGESESESAQKTSSDEEVDITLIRWMLSLSPIERLRTAQRYARSAQRLRNAPRRVRL